MYKAYCNGELMYSPLVKNLFLLTPTLELEDNSSGSFKFIITQDNPCYSTFKHNPKVKIEVFEDGKTEPIFVGRPLTERERFDLSKEILCEGELSFLADSNQPQAEYHDLTVRQYLETIINIHNAKVEADKQFQVGMVTVVDPNDKLFKYTNYETSLNVLKTDLLDTYGGHFTTRHKSGITYLDYLAEYKQKAVQTIKFGENLLDFAKNYDISTLCTAVIPLGTKLEGEGEIKALESYTTIKSVNGGSGTLVNAEAVNRFGYIERITHFDNVGTPGNLLKKGQEFLTDKQFANLTLEISALDLNALGVDVERINLLDEVRVISKIHGMDKYFPVTKLTINLDEPSQNTFTLGKKESGTLTGRGNSVVSGIQKEIKKIPNAVIRSATENASQLIQNALNGHIVMKPDELLIMDTDDINTATKVWRWNLNGLGYSGNGYNGTYSTAITMDGQIVGDHIVAGTVSAEKIDINYRNEINAGIDKAKNEAIKESETKLQTKSGEILASVATHYETIQNVDTKVNAVDTKATELATQAETNATKAGQDAATQAEANAKADTDSKLKQYYTKQQTDSALSLSKDAIALDVSKKYETIQLSNQKHQEALDAASQAETNATQAGQTAANQAELNATQAGQNAAVQAETNAKADTDVKLQNYTTKTELNSAIKVESDNITQTVSAKYETIDESNRKKAEAITAGQQAADQAETNANSNLNTYKKEVGTYLRHDVNGLELGDVEGKFKINITPTSQEFSEDNVVTAYVNNKEFHFNRGMVEESLRVGGYVFKQDPATGAMSLEWEEDKPIAEEVINL